jgi:tRNA threonylcarbamoyladenosine biosynthesis protein TsaB
LAEFSWQVGRQATVHLLPALQHSFHLLAKNPDDLTSIAVALGPGSFNSLRVGVSFAKGLALSQRIPIVGLPTPDLLAYPFSSDAGTGVVLPVCAILKAGRGRLVTGLYQTRYGRWQRIGDFDNTTLEELCHTTERATVFCGEIDAEMAVRLREQLSQRALIASAALSVRRAGYLAEMAWNRLQEDPQGDDLASLQPLYVSRPRIGGKPPKKEEPEES